MWLPPVEKTCVKEKSCCVEKSGKYYDQQDRLIINQWLMAQMGTVGPMIGQHHQFHHYNPGKSKFGENRYFKIVLYFLLNKK